LFAFGLSMSQQGGEITASRNALRFPQLTVAEILLLSGKAKQEQGHTL
jgi:hypothetical protein